jgi:HEAT repeat protein
MLPILFLLLAPPADPSANQRAWTMLKQGVADKSATRRAKAVHALGLLKNDAVQNMAESALDDPDKGVRSEAAIALGKMNRAASRPKLRACLDDKQVQVVLACANALYLLKDPKADEIYYALLTETRKSSKGLLQSQLDTLRDRKQVEKLAFETGIGFVPYGGMGWEAIKTIRQDDSSPVRALAAQRLAADPDPKSGKALAEFATDKKALVREAVIEAIAKRGDPALLPDAIARLDDNDESVRFEAAATVVSLSERRVGRKGGSSTRRR